MSAGRPDEPTGPLGPDGDAEEATDGGATQPAERAAGPPGSGVFSLEGRPAPGLYLVAWLLSGAGLAVAFIGSLTAPPVSGVLAMAALILLGVGLSAGAGYQVIARSSRPASAYRGPSPVIVFGVLYVAAVAVGLVALVVGGGDPTSVPGFLIGGVTLFGAYVLAVWLFAVRTGALSWSDMGLPRQSGLLEYLASAGLGAAVMLPVTFIALLVGGLVATLVDARPPNVVPAPEGVLEVAAVALAAVVLIPIGEELFFRGFTLTAWLRDKGPRRALAWSAIFFTLVHIANITAGFEEGARQALVQSAVILPLGVVLGGLFLLRGLVAAIAGHVTYNATVLVLTSLAQQFVPAPAG